MTASLYFLVLVVWVVFAAGQTVHNVSEPFLDEFVCVGNATESAATALDGNPAALDVLRGWCATDPRCAELYGQEGLPNLALFTHIFQVTLQAPIAGVFLESPLFDLLCNRTAEEFLRSAWVVLLTSQRLDTPICAENERPILSGASVVCVCQPGKVCDASGGTFVVSIIVVVAVALAVVVQFAVNLWNQTRLAPERTAMSALGGAFSTAVPSPTQYSSGGDQPPLVKARVRARSTFSFGRSVV